MKKIISLLIICMLTIGMVGCGKNECMQMQKHIDIFKDIDKTKVETCCITDYCNSFNIEGVQVNYDGGDDVEFIITIQDNDGMYEDFLKFADEECLNEAVEKYEMDELMNAMVETGTEQYEIVKNIQGEEMNVDFIIAIYDKDGNLEGVIRIFNGNKSVHVK